MWFYAALGMALISGLCAIISKRAMRTISPLTFFWGVLTVSAPIVWIFAWSKGVPDFSKLFFVGVIGSVVFYSISKILFYRTIRDAELSHVHPLVALGPVFTLGSSFLILSEVPSLIGFIGIGITLVGTYVLNISSIREGLWEPFKILFRNNLSLLMLYSVLIGSISPVFDKLAIIHTSPQNEIFALLMEDLVIVFGLLPWMLLKNKTVAIEIKFNWKWILTFGLLQAVSNTLAFISLAGANPGLVTSVFRTQIFFVLLFSYLFFGDRPKTETIVGSIIMIGGLVVLKLAT
ncbi:hypothetical protein A3E95_00730 [Candidatus Nomurabacteria bacterium RIFCSPHIGHO2_12_FULL_44_22b]|nr:MAG: hypothetical protein A3E95_00730 [Candidatus Nomurabacteria bacterium RIFCSPHIGHO2_12_FULL_44_22b]